jgi:hypothetical protein
MRISRASERRLYATARDFVWRGEQLWRACAAGLKDGTGAPSRVYSHMALVNKPAEITGFASCVRGPGEDPTGASAEWEGGFGPKPKGRRARGEYKGAREVLARHGRTAQPRGGPGRC